ncbi:hypothetical protein AWB76_04868 [Caballeronia temeraria]|uniref:Lipoprotein n=1 Tax=Caballeronia temeraria TaxID=1777137 RepID=A0A158BYM0_9BURK|nr:hypothetical protein AWB76_04868 [Caballeronia temeraria]
MNRIPTLLSVFLVAMSASATAQNSQTPSSPATQQGAPATGHAAKETPPGSSSAGSPTLMQEREKGMSPDAASGTGASGKTGKMKQ